MRCVSAVQPQLQPTDGPLPSAAPQRKYTELSASTQVSPVSPGPLSSSCLCLASHIRGPLFRPQPSLCDRSIAPQLSIPSNIGLACTVVLPTASGHWAYRVQLPRLWQSSYFTQPELWNGGNNVLALLFLSCWSTRIVGPVDLGCQPGAPCSLASCGVAELFSIDSARLCYRFSPAPPSKHIQPRFTSKMQFGRRGCDLTPH